HLHGDGRLLHRVERHAVIEERGAERARRVEQAAGDNVHDQAPERDRGGADDASRDALLIGPGINAVIAAATIEARNHGIRVLGCYDGFRWLVQGDTRHVVELGIDDLSRIHFEGGSILRTSRTNPTRTPDGVKTVAATLQKLNVNYLITIGGDDTAYAASQLARVRPGLTVAHVPKTIDNDLPLPSDIVTFGFTTATNLGKELVRNLMQDAATTERWFFVTVMGRHAGHLALGIGGSAAAT